jgi:hypothetical protein
VVRRPGRPQLSATWRNLAVAELLLQTLERLNPQLPETPR